MTAHGFMPGAVAKNIPPGSSDPAIIPAGVIQHVAVSNSPSLFGLFSNDGGIESHFYILKDGTIEQYRSIFFEADAQFAGNSFGSPRRGFVSVEHQGGVGADLNQPMPKAQLDAFHRVILWVKTQADFPLRVCPAWDAPGVGYHALFDQWNTNHHSCPGPARIAQFRSVTVPWLAEQSKPKPPPAPKPTLPTRIPRRSVEHPPPGHPEYEGDSRRAADHAAKTHRAAIDYNVLLDANGTPVNAHYGLPLHHGFVDPKKLIHADTPLHQMGVAEWSRLQTVKGTPPYVIRKMSDRIDYAVKLGLIVEADLKCDVPAETLRTLLRGKSVQFKTMATLNDADPRVGRPWVRLKHAKEAGGVTVLLCHRPFIKVPKEDAQFIDYYRGFRPRFV